MNRPEDAYRSAMNKVTAPEGWKARTRAAMAAAGSPRLRVVRTSRRVAGGLLAAACLVLVAIPVLRYGLADIGSVGGATAPNMAAYDAGAGAAEPRAMAMAPDEEAGQATEESMLAAPQSTAPAVTALEGLPEEGVAMDAVLARVGEDETSVYYLPGGLEGITAVYEDGSTEPLADALAAGRVTLADLQRLGAPLTAEPKAG